MRIEKAKSKNVKKKKRKETQSARKRVQGHKGQEENGERKKKRGPLSRDLTLPSVGLMAPGKLSQGRVQAGQG